MHLGSETYFYTTTLPKVMISVQRVTDAFLWDCKLQTPQPDNMRLIIDAGWSHPGWWARECSVIALDGKSGLPVAVHHVIRGKNFISDSSRGKCLCTKTVARLPKTVARPFFMLTFVGMEGYGVKEIMKDLHEGGFKVTRIIHDKDSSTMNQVMSVYQDVEESLCLSLYPFI